MKKFSPIICDAGLQVSEVELTYISKIKPSERKTVKSSYEAYEIFKSAWPDIDLRESFKVMFMNKGNKVLAVSNLSKGGLTSCSADPRHIIIAALRLNACIIMIAHNHPSGTLQPSRADEELTTKIRGACALLDIKLLDHIILTSESYYSFVDEGHL